MQIYLEIEYYTQWGEALYINGDFSIAMESEDGKTWRAEIETHNSVINYSYSVVKDSLVVDSEWGAPHTLELPTEVDECYIIDKWSNMPNNKAYYSSLFRDSVYRRITPTAFTPKGGAILLEAEFPRIESYESLAVVGNIEQLGNWNASKALFMSDSTAPKWRAQIEVDSAPKTIEYKFVIINLKSREIVQWEEGENRVIELEDISKTDYVALLGARPKFNLTPYRGAGVAIPLFSLRTEQSMGVGDFLDLKKMVDWAKITGQKIIQILPINDTTMSKTWADSYPYNANSTFALHPMYISLLEVGELKDEAKLAQYRERGAELNKLDEIDYEAVNNLKNSYLNDIFAQESANTFKSKEFKSFFEANRSWLDPYALFSLLRDKYETPDFSKWGDESKFTNELLESYISNKRSKNYKAISYYYFVQYHLHIQLSESRDYAHQNGVVLKGDIPIGISPTSVDAWTMPRLFNMSSQAGAPPDPFSDLGQNWGFPTYNWGAMLKEDYKWWKARFTKMAEYFDAYRIDHILGFFRIWDIPKDAVYGMLGHFSPALPFSVDEINSTGFGFDLSYTKPYISHALLLEVFGGNTNFVIDTYLDKAELDLYKFKPEYNTQQKIQKSVADLDMRNKLMLLHHEVLFIEDPEKKGYYHPRIMGQNSFAYRALDNWRKECFNTLHNNFYYHRHNQFWQESAMSKLPSLVNATDMLVCGEDLGMIPHCVPAVMEQLQILSLEIERMPKDEALTYGQTWNYPYSSICTTSTHDMAPIRGWWREDRVVIQRYFNERLGEQGDAPEDATGWICYKIVKNHLDSPSIFTILPWQDWMSINEDLRHPNAEAERINIPANPKHYWRYRMHLTLEALTGTDEFNAQIKKMIRLSGR